MSATKPAGLTVTLQKATEGFTDIVDCPTDTDIINIQQLLLPVLMKTKYGKLTLKHNLLGVTLPDECYGHIHSNGAYLIPPVIALNDNIIDKDAPKTEVHRAEGKTKPSEITVCYTKQPIHHARTSLWKSSMRRGTRSQRTQTHFLQT